MYCMDTVLSCKIYSLLLFEMLKFATLAVYSKWFTPWGKKMQRKQKGACVAHPHRP